MKTVSMGLDKLAIGLSLACAIHCLIIPIALVMLPTLMLGIFADESFHRWMVIAVLPTSLVALTLGCRKHKSTQVFLLGLAGLAILLLTALIGHDLFGETGEKIATMIGAATISLAHYKNHNLCKAHHHCAHH